MCINLPLLDFFQKNSGLESQGSQYYGQALTARRINENRGVAELSTESLVGWTPPTVFERSPWEVRGALPQKMGYKHMTSDLTELEGLGKAVIDGALTTFRANKGWADKAVRQLSDEKLHIALDLNTNTIAVIMKHVAGNLLSRWTDFLTTDGEKPWRNRDEEFVDSLTARDELTEYWNSGWRRLLDTLEGLSAADLGKTVTIRGEPHTVPLAIQRSLTHCGYHVGQIILIARILAGDNWTTITIPRGTSANFNQRVWATSSFRSAAERDDDR